MLIGFASVLSDNSAKNGPFRIFHANCIHYFRWTAVLNAGKKSFLPGPISEKFGNYVSDSNG